MPWYCRENFNKGLGTMFEYAPIEMAYNALADSHTDANLTSTCFNEVLKGSARRGDPQLVKAVLAHPISSPTVQDVPKYNRTSKNYMEID
jgi:hypothetical protein